MNSFVADRVHSSSSIDIKTIRGRKSREILLRTMRPLSCIRLHHGEQILLFKKKDEDSENDCSGDKDNFFEKPRIWIHDRNHFFMLDHQDWMRKTQEYERVTISILLPTAQSVKFLRARNLFILNRCIIPIQREEILATNLQNGVIEFSTITIRS